MKMMIYSAWARACPMLTGARSLVPMMAIKIVKKRMKKTSWRRMKVSKTTMKMMRWTLTKKLTMKRK